MTAFEAAASPRSRKAFYPEPGKDFTPNWKMWFRTGTKPLKKVNLRPLMVNSGLKLTLFASFGPFRVNSAIPGPSGTKPLKKVDLGPLMVNSCVKLTFFAGFVPPGPRIVGFHRNGPNETPGIIFKPK